MSKTFYIDDLNKTVNFKFDFDAELVQEIKGCDYNSRWNPEHKQWIVPINKWSIGNIERIVSQNNFKKVEKPKEEEVNISYERSEIDISYVRGLCDSKDFAYKARDYQLECLAYSKEKGNVLNGDDVGLGKTFESILYAETSNSFPCLVVVPASVKYNWKEKWEEITKGKREVSVIESRETTKHKNNWNADVVLINYDIIGKKQGTGATVKFKELVERDWEMVIFDEGHFLKNKKAQRSKAAKMISKKTDGLIQILTGTAITSKPVEIWNLLTILKKDHLIANDWFQFVHRYCGAYRGKFGLVTDGATNILELNKVLRENCYIRREKEEVLGELPSMIEQVIQIPITNKRAITKATENFIEYITETKGDEAAEKAMAAEHLVALGELRKLAIEGKLKSIEQWLKDWRECYPSDKVVIFGVHREPLQKLATKFKSPIINGGISSKKKQEIIKDFQSSDDLFLFANIAAAGTGVDGLQLVSSNMLIIELPWLTSDLTQVKGRLHRSGQKKPPNINFMLSDETIDEQMWSMLMEKERVTEAVNKGIDVKKQGSGMRAVIRKILKSK
jgi:SWI/SNF-related matrix-associated actin-dependent regulator 1 of chromatin subfamily A